MDMRITLKAIADVLAERLGIYVHVLESNRDGTVNLQLAYHDYSSNDPKRIHYDLSVSAPRPLTDHSVAVHADLWAEQYDACDAPAEFRHGQRISLVRYCEAMAGEAEREARRLRAEAAIMDRKAREYERRGVRAAGGG